MCRPEPLYPIPCRHISFYFYYLLSIALKKDRRAGGPFSWKEKRDSAPPCAGEGRGCAYAVRRTGSRCSRAKSRKACPISA